MLSGMYPEGKGSASGIAGSKANASTSVGGGNQKCDVRSAKCLELSSTCSQRQALIRYRDALRFAKSGTQVCRMLTAACN